MKNWKRLCSISFIILFLFILIAPLNVQALTAGKATYNESQMLDRTNLGYGVSYYKSIGRTSSTVRSGEFNQTVYYLNTPATDGVRVVSWAKFEDNEWVKATVKDFALDFEEKNPGWKVIAGVNGDFFDINGTGNFPFQTSSGVAYDGNFYKTGGGYTIGIKNDGSEDSLVWGYNPSETGFILDVFGENNEIIASFPINKNNVEPGANETSVYYGTYNSLQAYTEVKLNLSTVLAKYYIEAAELALPNSTNDFYGLGVISSLNPQTIEKGQFAIITNNQAVADSLAIGKEIRVQKKWTGEYANIKYATGAGTALLLDGVVPSDVNSADSRMSSANPRTAIGRKADGSIVMAVVDGRLNPSIAAGVYGDELAVIMAHAGCVEAYNLDGGGSSTIVLRDEDTLKTVNVPSDGFERRDSNALLVVTREPEVQIQMIDATDKTINLDVSVLDQKEHRYDALYASMNGEDVEVVNEKVTFSGLQANTEYTCKLFYKLGNRKIEFLNTYKFTTTVTPHSFFRVEITKTTDSYTFEAKYRDRDGETNLPTADLIINNIKYQLTEGKLSLPISTISSLETITLQYQVSNSLGTKLITIPNPDSISLRFLDEFLTNYSKNIKLLFK